MYVFESSPKLIKLYYPASLLSNWATLNISEKTSPLNMMNVQYAASLGIRTLSALGNVRMTKLGFLLLLKKGYFWEE